MIKGERNFIQKYLTSEINLTNGLDLGCGPAVQVGTNQDYQAFRGTLTGVDTNKDFKPDLCCNILNLKQKIKDNSMRFIVLAHTLEDMENPYQCLRLLVDLLEEDGILAIICPYRGKYHRIGTEGANGGHKYDFDPQDLEYMVWRCFGKVKKNFHILSMNTLDNNYSFELVVQKKCEKVDHSLVHGFVHLWEDDGSSGSK